MLMRFLLPLLSIPLIASSEIDLFQITPKDSGAFFGHTVWKGERSNLSALSIDPKNFRDLYVVRLPLFLDIQPILEAYGSIVKFVPHDFAVVRLSEPRAEKLSGVLHGGLAACGTMVKLNPEDDLSGEIVNNSPPIHGIDNPLKGVTEIQKEVNSENIKATIKELEAMGTRYHKSPTGIEVPAKLKEKYEAYAQGRSDVKIDFFKNYNSPQDNIRVRIEGTTRPDEVILLGSHIDSINSSNNKSAPGADDNASGTATNLEIFRVIMESGWKFDRSIEIHGYGAEELGLWGSNNMAKEYKEKNINVISMVQFDMNLFQRSSDLVMWFISNDTDQGFTKELQQLVVQYQNLPVNQKAVYAGTSDHRSWSSRGFKAAFPFEDASSYNNKIHSSGDTFEYAGNQKLTGEFAKLGLAYFAHYAGKI